MGYDRVRVRVRVRVRIRFEHYYFIKKISYSDGTACFCSEPVLFFLLLL